jgi:excisionase family DNA binding protein
MKTTKGALKTLKPGLNDFPDNELIYVQSLQNNDTQIIKDIENGDTSPEYSDHLWTITDLAAYLQVRPGLIKYWVHCSNLPHIKLGRNLRFDPADIKNWITDHKSENGQAISDFKKIK